MYVYRFLNKNNEVIYIGRTKDLQKRMEDHNHLSYSCYSRVSKIEYITLKNNDESAIYERYLINKLNPKYNREYKNMSTFGFDLPEKEWEHLDYSFNVKKPNNIDYNITSSILTFKEDIDIHAYIIFCELGDITDDEYNLYKLLIASCGLGGVSLEDNERYKKEDMLDFIKYLMEQGIVEIHQEDDEFCFKMFNIHKKIDVLKFNELKLFKGSYLSYKTFKKFTQQEREDLFKDLEINKQKEE